MDVRLPDGTIIKNVPDGTTKADLVTKLQRNGMAVPSEWLAQEPKKPERSFIESAGDAVKDTGRQVLLTARYALEGLGQTADIFTEPIAAGMRYAGIPVDPTSKAIGSLFDKVGLTPKNAEERVIGDISRTVAGAGNLIGLGRGLASAGANRFGKAFGGFLSEQPAAQLGGAIGSGFAGGAVRESGGSEGDQVIGSVLGGLTGAAARNQILRADDAFQKATSRLSDLVNPGRIPPIDLKIEAKLKGSDIDWSLIPERVRQSVRRDVQQALKVGDDLDAEALRRLVDFRSVGATPTRGTLTLDPVQITQERNLAKSGANSRDINAQRLTSIQADNNAALLRNIEDLGASRGSDIHAMGDRGIAGLQNWLDENQDEIRKLYQAARDSKGRSLPLDGIGFANKAAELLDQNLLGYALPGDVRNHLNKIARKEVPFNVDYAEQLKTVIGKLQRGTNDGSTRMALGMVRRALDDVTPAGSIDTGSGIPNPGNLPAARTQNAILPMEEGAIAAFKRARAANREMMVQVEKTPALQKLRNGDISPDDFIRRYVTSQSAKVRDVSEMVKVIGKNGKEALRDGVLSQLREAATGGAKDEIAKFSAVGFRRALDKIGDRKLDLLFSKEDVKALKALSRVADYTTHQPVGSAVNNSNSGALLVGKGMDLLNGMGRLGDFLKIGGLGDQLNVIVRGRQEKRALDTVPSLVRRPEVQQFQLRQLAAPAGISSALFATPLLPQTGNDD